MSGRLPPRLDTDGGDTAGGLLPLSPGRWSSPRGDTSTAMTTSTSSPSRRNADAPIVVLPFVYETLPRPLHELIAHEGTAAYKKERLRTCQSRHSSILMKD